MTTVRVAVDRRTHHAVIEIPYRLRHRGGRKIILTPSGGLAEATPRPRVDGTLMRALARSHRWQRMLDADGLDSLLDLSRREKVNGSYLARMLRITLLAPDLIERILNGTHGSALTLARLTAPFPVAWVEQRMWFADQTLGTPMARQRSTRCGTGSPGSAASKSVPMPVRASLVGS